MTLLKPMDTTMNRTRPRPGPPSHALALLLAAMHAALIIGCGLTGSETVRLDLPHDAPRLAVDVDNFAGIVIVEGDASADAGTATIKFNTWTTGSAGRYQHALARGITYDAIIEHSPAGAVLRVSTDSAFPDDPDHGVDIHVRVPKLHGVDVRTTNARIDILNARGAATADTADGQITFRTPYIVTQPLQFTTSQAPITLFIPRESPLRLDARSIGGQAVLDGIEEDVRGARYSQGALLVDLNHPDPSAAEAILRTTVGPIVVQLRHPGSELDGALILPAEDAPAGTADPGDESGIEQ